MTRARYESLDGLRGIAAMTVVIYHFASAYIPSILSQESPRPWFGSDTPMGVLYNGGFAVSVFFVLSGFVVSNSAAKRRVPTSFNLVQRYFRLAVPCMVSTVLAWAWLTAFPTSVHGLKLVEMHPWLNYVYDGVMPGPITAALDGAFLTFQDGYSDFNGVLWTMQIELYGSCALYIIFGLTEGRLRVAILMALGVVMTACGMPEYTAFALGALLREAVAAHRLPKRLGWWALGFGIVFGSMTEGLGDRLGLHVPSLIELGETHKVWHVLAAVALLYAVLNLEALKRPLSHPVARFLGYISFGVYLIHTPLLVTVFAEGYLRFAQHDIVALAGLFVAFLVAAVGLGAVFTVLVDRPVLWAIRQAQRRVRPPEMVAGGLKPAT